MIERLHINLKTCFCAHGMFCCANANTSEKVKEKLMPSKTLKRCSLSYCEGHCFRSQQFLKSVYGFLRLASGALFGMEQNMTMNVTFKKDCVNICFLFN